MYVFLKIYERYRTRQINGEIPAQLRFEKSDGITELSMYCFLKTISQCHF